MATQQPATSVAKIPDAQRPIAEFLNKNKSRIANLLQERIDPAYFLSLWMVATGKTPKLLQCTEASVFGAIVQLASLALEPNSPRQEVALIPFTPRDGQPECQVVIMRNGYVRLALRTGMVSSVKGMAVRERDVFDWDEAEGGLVRHRPFLGLSKSAKIEDDDPGGLIAAYGVAHIMAAVSAGVSAPGRASMLVPGYRVRQIKARSMARLKDWQIKNSPWTTDEAEMWAKTGCKRICALLLQHFDMPDLAKAMEADQKVVKLQGTEDWGITTIDVESAAVTDNPHEDDGPAPQEKEKEKETTQEQPREPPPAQVAFQEYQGALRDSGMKAAEAEEINQRIHGKAKPSDLSQDQLRESAKVIREQAEFNKSKKK